MGVFLKQTKQNRVHFDAESILGGKTGTIKRNGTEYQIAAIGIPECTESCPAGVNVKAYVNLIANRKFEEAIEIIRQANPFPAVCGRVCTRPCELTCELGKNGDSIQIRALKRYASDYELARRDIIVEPCEITYDEKIAIIGAGPAGLTAAVDLIRKGYSVTVFEQENEPGGMLRYAIPPYRLPDRVLKREIDWIKNLGIILKTKQKITDPAALLQKGFSAVLIASGAPKSFPLGIEGEKAKGVIDALQFLREVNSGKPKTINKKVVVIGGGSTAFDAARSALRLKAKETILAYRRSIAEMPADHEEIEAAQQEGVEIKTLAIPKKIITRDGKVTGIEFLKARLGKPDKSGRRRPEPIAKSEYIINTEIVIPAVGAMPDVGAVGGVQVTTSKGTIKVSDFGGTIKEGIFAAGDVEMGPSSVVDAIGRGHQAAKGIDAYLRDIIPKKTEDMLQTLQIYLGSPRSKSKHNPKKQLKNIQTFNEVEQTYTDFEAVEEASRCFTCGPCYACPTCLPTCINKQLVAEIENTSVLVKAPAELSLEITQKGPTTYKLTSPDGTKKTIQLHSLTSQVNPDLCIGCGRCEELCAYHAIQNIVIKNQQIVSQVAHNSCSSCSACVSECPSGAISQGYMSDSEILTRLQNKHTPYPGIKALMSFWCTKIPVFNAYDGVIELLSVRKPSPQFLIRALARTQRGLLIIKPDENTKSHYLPWEEPPEDVIQNTKHLLKTIGISPERIQYLDLPTEEKPTTLLHHFSEQLNRKNIQNLRIPLPKTTTNPLGEALTLLRILAANPDQTPIDTFNPLKPIKAKETAFFEGCLPLLHLIGTSHKLYDLGPMRNAIYHLLQSTPISVGYIPGLLCPSKELLRENTKEITDLVQKISQKNQAALHKTKPNRLIVATPECYHTFSQEKLHIPTLSTLPNELYTILKSQKNLKKINHTVALHSACTLDYDSFYEPIKKILQLIPGIKIIELNEPCGQHAFTQLNQETKKTAVRLMKKATDQHADMLICTSPNCQAHLFLCSREGFWRSVEIEISDIYQLLLSSISGEP